MEKMRVKKDQIKAMKLNDRRTGKRIDPTLCIGINARTVTVSTVPAVSRRSLLLLDHFGIKIKSLKLFNTTNRYSNKPKRTKDIEKIVLTVMSTNDIIHFE